MFRYYLIHIMQNSCTNSDKAGMGGVGNEEQQGKALVDASLQERVKFFVYSSVDRGGSTVNDPTNIPHFISKANIEQHLFEKSKNTDMRWTVLRPVAFFENLAPGFIGKVFATSFQRVLKNKPLQLIATSDIGFFAAQAFLKPDEWAGKCLSLAGDELTFQQFRDIFRTKTGGELPMTFGFIAGILLWMIKDVGAMYRWFYEKGYGADIPSLRKIHPDLQDFGTWLERESKFEKH